MSRMTAKATADLSPATAANSPAKADHSAQSQLGTILLAAFLGLGLIFLSGLAHSETLHDAAHDLRHAAGYPCH